MKKKQLYRKRGREMRTLGINYCDVNSVRFNGKESLSHRMTKLIICHMLNQRGHLFKTEQVIGDARCDIIDLDTFIVYEIETNSNSSIIKKKLDDYRHPMIEDLVIVDLRKLDLDIASLFEFKDKISKSCGL